MKQEFDLEFCFKGNRKYVHGTDIFSKLLEKCHGEIQKIDIAFHDVTVKNMTFLVEKPEHKDIKVTFRALCNNKKIKFFGIENSLSVSCRYDYFEEKIKDNTAVDLTKKTIHLVEPTEYNFIEHIVAMNKILLEELYEDIDGKWYFTRLQLDKNIKMERIASLDIHFNANFQFKLTKSIIIADNEEVGYIYFSLVPKES